MSTFVHFSWSGEGCWIFLINRLCVGSEKNEGRDGGCGRYLGFEGGGGNEELGAERFGRWKCPLLSSVSERMEVSERDEGSGKFDNKLLNVK